MILPNPKFGLTTAPDWFVYLRAATSGFHALVGRDWRQINQESEPEMLALANLRISVVTWRDVFQDPPVETGQLLAYLPQIKRHLAESKPRVILLPAPAQREELRRITAATLGRPTEADR